jgi:hypothetical protein
MPSFSLRLVCSDLNRERHASISLALLLVAYVLMGNYFGSGLVRVSKEPVAGGCTHPETQSLHSDCLSLCFSPSIRFFLCLKSILIVM